MPPKGPLDDIPDEEKARLIGESGLLGQIQRIERPEHSASDDESTDLGDEIFQSVLLIIPMASLYIIMDSYGTYAIPQSTR